MQEDSSARRAGGPGAGAILVVCTGNVCRSPFAARRLTSALGHDPSCPVVVDSRGTRALVGQPIAAPMAALMMDEGLDPTGFAASQLTLDDLRRADLIITADRRQRGVVARMLPAAVDRSFTLRQLVRLLPRPGAAGERLEPSSQLRRLASAASAARGVAAPSAGAEDDIPDPWGRPSEVYRDSAAIIRSSTDALVTALRG